MAAIWTKGYRMIRPALATLCLMVATPALAHHPLGGLPMETFRHGVLSGLGHPVLGFDHLFFVLAAGLAAGLAGIATRGVLSPQWLWAAWRLPPVHRCRCRSRWWRCRCW